MGERRRRGPAPRFEHRGVRLERLDDAWVATFPNKGAGTRTRVRLFARNAPVTEDQARAALVTFAETRALAIAQRGKITVGELWDLWMADRAGDGFSNDIYNHQWKALRPHFGASDPLVLEAADFRAYAQARFKLGRAQSTVHTELRRLHACLKWAADSRLIPHRPRPWAPRGGRPRQRVLSREDARRLIAATHGYYPHVGLFVVLLFTTGARHTAILDLTWDRVNFDAGTITYDDDVLRDPMDKSWSKGRATVLMGKAARAALMAAAQVRQTPHVIEYGVAGLKDCREGFRKVVVRAGLWNPDERITPHTIRHTVATWLEEAAQETKRTAQLLGHADERTTRAIYTHARPEVLAGVVAALDAAIEVDSSIIDQ